MTEDREEYEHKTFWDKKILRYTAEVDAVRFTVFNITGPQIPFVLYNDKPVILEVDKISPTLN